MSELERWWNPIPENVKDEIRAMIESKFSAPQVAAADEARDEIYRRQVRAEIVEAELKWATDKAAPTEAVIDGTPSSPVAEWDAAGEKSDID